MNADAIKSMYPATWGKALKAINLRTIGANYNILAINVRGNSLRITYRPWSTPLGVGDSELEVPIKEAPRSHSASRSWDSGCGWGMRTTSDGRVFVAKAVQP